MDVNRKELSAIKEALRENSRGMTITELSKAVGLNRHSVAKYTEVLVAAGHVDMRSFGPSKVYFLSQRVPISAMLSFSSDLIITLDKDLRVKNVNDRFLEIMNLSREQLLNKNIKNFHYHTEYILDLMPSIEAALGGKDTSVELFYQGRTGDRYFVMKSLPTVFEDGETGVTLILSDITEKKQAEEALRRERAELEIRVKERTAELEKANEKLKAEIEQRIRSEQALRESEEKYRNLVESISDVSWEIDSAGRFTYISPRIKDMMGYEPADFIGKTIEGFLAPGHARDIIDNVAQIFADPKHYSLQETHVLHRDGHEIILEANGTVLYDDGGNFRGYRGVIRDVTARKQAEEAVRRAEEKYRNLVEDVNDWIWECDLTGQYTYSSPKVYDILGYHPEEVVGLRSIDLMAPEKAKKMAETIVATQQGGTPPQMLEVELLHKDGRTIFLEVSGKPISGEQGAVIGFRGVARDVTEKKHIEQALLESESRLRSTIENVNDIVWEMDREAKFTYVSPKVKDILGYDPEYYLGRVIVEFMPQEDVPHFSEGFGRIFANPRPYSLEHMRMFHRSGRILSMEVNGSPFYDENGQFCGFRGVTRDITNRKLVSVKPGIS
ncbi:PAS domain S-box protein [Methanocella arvoryzae]|uniref:histidine kinase n=1 Tax=Methanocella arvoryzae (strain DSM 22066 / NBRC 105507 / MRE50) TaxID=351160 RepID=Q0W3N0_METAR|nr:PAS domain S-box protein [Methanocella arvoryzae]CAJ37013.1 predicted signal transduction protein [Methanocella arvoryzae MRE50]